MGLSRTSVGKNSVDEGLIIRKLKESDQVIALAGNPNVGKSTVFNQLTGMKQHTGNWPGKTVSNAQGYCNVHGQGYVLVDIPGCYSLMAHSQEEEVARDFICFEHPDAVVVVCDASCLERNLNLVLQVIEAADKVIVCVNLMDEARKKKIHIDFQLLSVRLGVPVIGTEARSKKGLGQIFEALESWTGDSLSQKELITYPEYIEEVIQKMEPMVKEQYGIWISARWLSIRLMDGDQSLLQSMEQHLGNHFSTQASQIQETGTLSELVDTILEEKGITKKQINDDIAAAFVHKAEDIIRGVISCEESAGKNPSYSRRDRRLDRIFTSKITGFPIMFLVLMFIFWLTITGANYPSQLLSSGLFWIEDRLVEFALWAGIPMLLIDVLIFGVYRTLSWVVSVMLPPMAIFFPLFTLLEDFGYLPRVAFNLDKCFKCCHACGKQALTTCMGFGCNAAGVIGCRIIDSPRERLIAIITNSFVPCNGRFPMMITLITIFFAGMATGFFKTLLSSFILAGVILLGIAMTLITSKVLSTTILKGLPSSFTLELPPYRRPQIGKVILRSMIDRTLFVLARAVMAAAPAGLIIWIMANTNIDGQTILAMCSGFLDPFGKFIGMDGVILLAFLLGFPANEIVVPIMIMAYMAQGSLLEINDLSVLKELLVTNGWTWITALSTILFSLMHWPCSTTCLTIKKETGSLKWTLISIAIPTAAGIIICAVFANTARLFQ